jgi:ribosomal protein L37AE/L43A
MSEINLRAAQVYHCPFCGDEDLRPQEEPTGAWLCGACSRVFTATLVRLDESRIPGRINPGGAR